MFLHRRRSLIDVIAGLLRAAAGRNTTVLTRATQAQREQPGCLHAAMDLYKFCYQLAPLIDSALMADCFELAHAAREIDMRASPYDLRAFGYTPVCIETAAGRAEYVRLQAGVADRAADLRAQLRHRCRLLLEHLDPHAAPATLPDGAGRHGTDR